MRVVLAPIGTTGDVVPLVVLGAALREAGWDVSACTTRDFRELFEGRGIRFLPIELDAKDLSAGLDGGIPNLLRGAKRVRPVARLALDVFDDAFRDVDVVVGSGLQLFAPAFCASRGIHYVYASTAPTNERSAGLPPHFIPLPRSGRALNAALWAVQNAVFDQLFHGVASDAYGRAGSERPPKRLLESISETALVLGMYDRAIVGPEHRGAVPLGAGVFNDEGQPLDPDLEAFLESGPPPVYIGFGSISARDADERTALVLAVLHETGLRAVLDKGWGGLAERTYDERVHWSAGFNHRSLLPRVAAIVHHGGSGTTATASRVGVPQVIVPHITDQFYFGRCIAARRAGPQPIPAKRLTRTRLVERLRSAVSDPVIRTGAAALADELRDVDGPRAAVAALEAYASR